MEQLSLGQYEKRNLGQFYIIIVLTKHKLSLFIMYTCSHFYSLNNYCAPKNENVYNILLPVYHGSSMGYN